MLTIGLIAFYVLCPALIIWLCRKFPTLNKIGDIVICYAVGLILGNIGILPDNFEKMQDTLTMVTIPLALPLLLFSSDLRAWLKLALRTLLSMFLGVTSMLVVIIIGYFLFRNDINEIWNISGLLVGVYTGGTPNMASIKTALGIDIETYIVVHSYEMLAGSILLTFFITIAQKTLRLVLPRFSHSRARRRAKIEGEQTENKESYEGIFAKDKIPGLLLAYGITILIFAIGSVYRLFIHTEMARVFSILTITTLGLAFSFVKKVNKIEKTFQSGMYLILIFSLVVASMANFEKLFNSSIHILYYVSLTMFGAFILHIFLSSIFRIDTDTTIITSTGLIMSPPFVPVIASSLKNKFVIISGITVGIVGYAIGNYLGVTVAYILQNL